jgi:hypothetical protein
MTGFKDLELFSGEIRNPKILITQKYTRWAYIWGHGELNTGPSELLFAGKLQSAALPAELCPHEMTKAIRAFSATAAGRKIHLA